MKKTLSALFFGCIAASAFAFSLDDFNLSVEPLFAVRWGQTDEYLYSNISVAASDLKSYLKWEEEAVCTVGAKISGGWKNINAAISFQAAPSQSSGQMLDSDWYNIELTSASAYQYKTHYTESNNNINALYSFESNAGYTFDISPKFSIAPFIGFDYTYYKFSAKGLSGAYGNENSYGYREPWYSSNSTVQYRSSSTTVLTYERYTQMFWLGTNFTFKLPYSIKTSCALQVAPYVNTVSYDHHCLTGGYYADGCSDFFCAAKATVSVEWSPQEKFTCILSGSYFNTRDIRGDTYESSDSGSTYTQNTSYAGGAAQKEYTVTASVRYTIF